MRPKPSWRRSWSKSSEVRRRRRRLHACAWKSKRLAGQSWRRLSLLPMHFTADAVTFKKKRPSCVARK
eukprot:g28696.t1